ncbi:beta-ketoacyl synthase N-terminal-like domain-containing protein [Chengkuizengella sp. SCS-71B]|uniref:beta-ketoacyl synthase N-terminal-like domain-containing protein n=1 Tax=Chengkuizengella sp. SCS-71B TaxID=3115290 RepID=UPI0032C22678
MENLSQMIFEKVSKGRMDKETALELLKSIKLEGMNEKVNDDIAIIGCSVHMPKAKNLEQYWDLIAHKKESITKFPNERQKDCLDFIKEFTSLREKDIQFSHGGYLDDVDQFDYSFFNLSPKEAALMDPNQRLFLESAWQCIDDAGYGGKRITGSRTGVYLGYADWPVYGQYISKKQPSNVSIASAGNTPSLIASRIAYMLDLKGPAFLVDTACSSSLVAVHLACMALKNNECDMAITGGVKVCLMPVDGVYEIGIESSSHYTSTFDDRSDGTVWGEGTVSLLLKPLQKSLKDLDHIYAVIKGSSSNQDGSSVGITAPNAAAQEQVLLEAWRDAGINPETIGYIEAHGTGTKLGDPIEIDGIQRAFRQYTNKKQFCAIGSVKTNIGHLDSASGIAGLVKGIAALKYKQLPPTINFAKPNRNIAFENSPVYVNDRLVQWETEEFPRRCGVSSFGFSGTNCHVVLEEAPLKTEQNMEKTQFIEMDEIHLLVLSAKSQFALKELIYKYRDVIALSECENDIKNICYTSNTGRAHYQYRLAMIAGNKQDLLQKLDFSSSIELQEIQNKEIYYGNFRIIAKQKLQTGQDHTSISKKRNLDEQVVELLTHGFQKDDKESLRNLCLLFVKGADIDWSILYKTQQRRKVPVPAYPFQKTRCWISTNILEDASDDKRGTLDFQDHSDDHIEIEEISIEDIVLTGLQDKTYNSLHRKIAHVWANILGMKEININDDFFEIGGNSILSIKMEVDLEKKYDLQLTSDEIYEYRSIKEFAIYLNGPEITIEPMEPFNDLYYRSCFYNSLFPIINHFGGDIMYFLLNDMILYKYEQEETENFSIQYAEAKPLNQIFDQVGLLVNHRFDNSNIVEELKQCISDGKPVVIWLDAFYESIRKDTYQKQHLDHTILVYGFNEKEQQFHIIEHDRRENLTYQKCKIPFSDIEKGCKAFSEHFVNEDGTTPTHYIFEKKSNYDFSQHIGSKELYQNIFLDSLLTHKHKIYESLEVINLFMHSFKQKTSSEAELKRNLDELIEFLNEILIAKQVEKYRFTKLFHEGSEVANRLEQVIKKWDFIRKGVVRFMYLPVYKSENFTLCYQKLTELATDEKQLFELLHVELEQTIIQDK